MENEVIVEIEGCRNWDDGCKAGAIVVARSVPLLDAFVPYCGTVQVGRFKVTRRKVDQLDQFTIVPPSPLPNPCPKCGRDMKKWTTCSWC